MGTISAEIAKDIMLGLYEDDEPSRIVTYENDFDGSITWAVIFVHENKRKYHESPFCHHVAVVWDKETGEIK